MKNQFLDSCIIDFLQKKLSQARVKHEILWRSSKLAICKYLTDCLLISLQPISPCMHLRYLAIPVYFQSYLVDSLDFNFVFPVDQVVKIICKAYMWKRLYNTCSYTYLLSINPHWGPLSSHIWDHQLVSYLSVTDSL